MIAASALSALPPGSGAYWNIAVILNVLGAGVLRLFNGSTRLRRRNRRGAERPVDHRGEVSPLWRFWRGAELAHDDDDGFLAWTDRGGASLPLGEVLNPGLLRAHPEHSEEHLLDDNRVIAFFSAADVGCLRLARLADVLERKPCPRGGWRANW